MAVSRRERLACRIMQAVSSILLHELQDPRLGFTTVTGVELSSDLRNAKVRLSVLGDEKEQTVTMNAVRHARGYIQKLLGEELSVRYVPHLTFEADDSVKRSVNISRALRESRESREDEIDTGEDEE